MAWTTKIAGGLFALYGLVSLIGGIIGYVVTSNRGEPSYASLFAGTGAGLLLIGCAAGTFFRPLPALLGGAVVSIALLARFLPKVLESAEQPAGAVPILMTVGGILALAGAVVALGKRGGLLGGC